MSTTNQPTANDVVSVEYALQRLQERGFKAEIIEAEVTNPDGTKTKRRSVKILHTPPHEKALAAFFANPDAPCDFPGCQEFQRQYKTALEAAGGATCTSCEKGRIMRSMSPNIIKAMGLGLDKTNWATCHKEGIVFSSKLKEMNPGVSVADSFLRGG